MNLGGSVTGFVSDKVFTCSPLRCSCSCWQLLWSCSWRNPLRPRSWCNKCSVSPPRWDIHTDGYQSTHFSEKITPILTHTFKGMLWRCCCRHPQTAHLKSKAVWLGESLQRKQDIHSCHSTPWRIYPFEQHAVIVALCNQRQTIRGSSNQKTLLLICKHVSNECQIHRKQKMIIKPRGLVSYSCASVRLHNLLLLNILCMHMYIIVLHSNLNSRALWWSRRVRAFGPEPWNPALDQTAGLWQVYFY